jgi:hypothetical protein
MAFDELTLESFIWENTMHAADAVAPNLSYPPQERLPVSDVKPLARSKCRRRRRGTPPINSKTQKLKKLKKLKTLPHWVYYRYAKESA